MSTVSTRNVSRLTLQLCYFFFFQAEDGIRDLTVTGVQTCALPISCQLLRERSSESETILAIMQFRISDQPVPIKVCEAEGQPRSPQQLAHPSPVHRDRKSVV